jgi:PadR family transcriptional regulator PadR
MDISEKLSPLRKGLLEFVILKIVAGDKVYVADMLKLLGAHRIRDPGRDAVSPPQQAAARGTRGLRMAGVGSRPARASTTSSRRRAARNLSTLNDYWKNLNKTLADLGN